MPPSLPLRVLSSFVFLYLLVLVQASALTTAIAPNERVCFFADVDKAGEKIGVRAFFFLGMCERYGRVVLTLDVLVFLVLLCCTLSFLGV